MQYPHQSLWINDRDVLIRDILTKTAPYFNTFEQNVFAFIRDWLSDIPAFSLQTSGSTGASKTIIATRDQMIYSAKQTERALGLVPGTTALVCLDPQFIAGKMMLVRCFVTGMQIMAKTPSANVLDNIPDVSLELTAMVPYQIQGILESRLAYKLNNIRTVLIGGAALNDTTKHQLSQFKTDIYVTYGMTETISHVALQRVNGKNPEDHFKALPGITLQLDDRDCLIIKAPHLPLEIITNDIAQLVGLNGFRWLGRWDNVINTGGIKVIPEETEKIIQSVFLELGLNHEFFLTGFPDQKLGQRVVLIVKGQLTGYQKSEIITLARKKIQIYAAPKEVICLEQFHYTHNDKISRVKTVEMFQKRP
ncbi:MAG TPA: AMP-binding protein [Ohtaekwangia sp.]